MCIEYKMYSVAIVSLGRSEKVMTHTLRVLRDNNIDMGRVYLFIIEEEQIQYQKALDENAYTCSLIVGVRGIVEQREFVENYFKSNDNILCLDDDISQVDLTLIEHKNLDEFIVYAFDYTRDNNGFIWSVYPVFNPFFREKQPAITKRLAVMIGGFYGIINRPNELRLEETRQGEKEDVERTIRYFIKDRIIVRFNKVGFKTVYFGKDGGGLGKRKDRIPKSIEASIKLFERLEEYGKIAKRKDG